MKAILLVAGKSTRTWPLTITRPKPLLKILNKEILMHNLEAISGFVDEVFLVVGFKKEMILGFVEENKDKIKNLGLKIHFVEQEEQLGTGHALMQVFKKNPSLKGRFLVMMGDDLYSRKDVEECCKEEHCVLVKEVEDITRFGAVIEENGFLKEIIEKPKEQITNLANTGLYIISDKIIEDFKNMKKSERGEYEITEALTSYSKRFKVKVVRVKNYWLPITYPWSLLEANKFLIERIESDIKGVVEDGVVIKGDVIIGENTIVRSGVYIEGPVIIGENCKIGPNCYLRPGTVIGNNCHIGQAVEVKNSIFFDNSNCAHLSYIGDSIIGFNVNLGAGTITANLRHDDAHVKSMVKGELVDTGRRKFGTVIGDYVHTGIHTSIYPGRKIWPYKTTLPGEVVRKDIE